MVLGLKNLKSSDHSQDSTIKHWIERAKVALSYPSLWYNTVFKKSDELFWEDIEGNRYLGLTWASSRNLGFRNSEIIAAAKEQMNTTGVGNSPGVHHGLILLAEKLKEKAPGALSQGKVGFCNTGSDATEAAMMLARVHTGNQVLFAYLGGHHGSSSMGARSMTADNSGDRIGYLPLIPGVVHIPYPNCFRCRFGQEYPSCNLLCMDHISHLFDTVIHPEEVAAFFMESIQSNNVVVPPQEYFKRLKQICETHNILLVDDEVIIGFGRTGKMWGLDHLGIESDIMYVAKAIGNGISIGALLGTENVIKTDSQHHLVHGGAFGGNPVACACALAHFEILERDNLVENAAKLGDYLLTRLRELTEVHELMGDVRGKGLFLGIELIKDLKNKQPATDEAHQVVVEAFKRGVILQATGTYKQVIRLVPPLVITREAIDIAIPIFEEALKEVERNQR